MLHFMVTSKTATVAKRPTLAEKNKSLAEQVAVADANTELLSEALSNAVAMLRQEDIGWALPSGTDGYKGLSLADMKGWSEQIRASLTGTVDKAPNPHMRNGIMLRHSFIWDGGIHYDDVPGSTKTPTTQGVKDVQKILDRVGNQRLVFGTSARRKREHALFADGLYVVVGDAAKNLRPIPLSEITDIQTDELYQDDIIAYRWTRNEAVRLKPTTGRGGKIVPGQLTGEREEISYWVYVDWYEGDKVDYVQYAGSGKREKVLKDHVIFDLHANRPDGAPFGSPDAISALVWARVIRDLIMNGVKMQDALAMFAFKATSPTKAGQQAAAMELAKPTGAGSTATTGGDTNFDALSTAGKGYDFQSIGFVVSTMAASLHVSGIALAANTALAGSSYGAAQTLDLPGRMAMETRRAEHVEFDQRILIWLGAKDATIYFDTYEDATDEYRAVQAAMLAWTTGTLTPEGFREELALIYGREIQGSIPAGAINPNTTTAADKKLTTDAAKKALEAPAVQPTTTPAPGQGKATKAGGGDHTDDKPQSGK